MDVQGRWLTGLAEPWRSPAEIVSEARAELASTSKALVTAVEKLVFGRAAEAHAAAQQELEHARALQDGARALLALGLLWLAEVRMFQCLPNGLASGALELRRRFDGPGRLRALTTLGTELRKLPGARDASVAYRWLQVCACLPTLRANARSAPQAPVPGVADLVRRQLEDALEDARALSAGAVAIVELELATMLHGAGDMCGAQARLEAALAHYRGAEDASGVAACHVLRLEWALSSASSPLVRNLVLDEPDYPTSELPAYVEAGEGAAPTEAVARAEPLLAAARAALAAAKAPAALAGALHLLACYHRQLAGDRAGACSEAAAAVTSFEKAGDEARLQLARAHLLLARIDDGQLLGGRDVAAAIGQWGRAGGSFSYALGLGLSFTRAARCALLAAGDYERAQACLLLAQSLHEELGATSNVAQTLADLALLQQIVGNRARARTQRETAIDRLAQAMREHPDEESLRTRAQLLAQQVYMEALDHADADAMEAALTRLSALSSVPSATGFAANLLSATTLQQAAVLIPLYRGQRARLLGDQELAEQSFATALARAREREGTDALSLQAIVHVTRRDYAAGRAAHEAYCAAPDGPQGVSLLLSMLQQMNAPNFAFERDRAMARKAEHAFAFMVRARAPERARQELSTLERLRGERWFDADPKPWQPLCDIAEMHELSSDFARALDTYEQAIEAFESRRRRLSQDELKTALSSNMGVQFLYFQAVRAALALANQDESARQTALARAFALSERGRARALLDLCTSQLRAKHEPLPDALHRWRKLTIRAQVWSGLIAHLRADSSAEAARRRAELETQLERCNEKLLEAERTLVNSHPRFARAVLSEGDPLTLAELCAELDPETVVLQYMTLGDELLMWAVTREGMRSTAVVPQSAGQLAKQVRAFRESCAKGEPLPALRARGEELSKVLLAPLAASLRDHRRVLVVPYGELHLLPFAALPWEGGWLAEHKLLSQLPSASLLKVLREPTERSHESPLLAVGDPAAMSFHSDTTGEEVPLSSLPGARDEAAQVAKLFPGSTLLLGPDAGLARVEQEISRHRMILLATHAVVSSEAPLRSGVALADGGLLTVERLLGLRLSADVVVLSACQTGLGELTGGEEIVGLSRGMLAAGARGLIVSLWPVYDESTCVLMARLFTALRDGKVPADALQQAQSEVRAMTSSDLTKAREQLRDVPGEGHRAVPDSRGGDHPQRWAPFLVIGA